jgi:hypothetical protein
MFENSRHHSLIAWRRSGMSRLNFLNIAESSLAEVGYCGAPMTGLVRSTRAGPTITAFCLALVAAVVLWLAA